MSNKLYTGFSLLEFIWGLIRRLAFLIGLVYTLLHYNENPTAVLIISNILLTILFSIGNDQIVVCKDRVTQTENSFFSLIFNSKGHTFYISEINSAYLESQPKPSASEIGIAFILAFLLPKGNSNSDRTEPIFFEPKNGDIGFFDTTLE